MDIYRVKGTDGKTYKVRAPSPEAAASAVRTMLAADAPAAPAAPAARSGNTLVDVLRSGVGQGLGFGFGDEAEARVRSLFDDRSYGELRDDIRGQNQAFRSDNPLLAYGSEIGGALAPTLAAAVATPFTGGAAGGGAAVGAGRIGAAASKLLPKRRLARAATVGAAQGGVSGAGYADENKLEGAAYGAGLGAGIGGVGAAVLPKLTPVAQRLLAEGKSLTPGQALGGIYNTLEQQSTSLPFVGQVIAKARTRANPDIYADAANQALGDVGRSLTNRSAKPLEVLREVRSGVNAAYDDIARSNPIRGNGAQALVSAADEAGLGFADKGVQTAVQQTLKKATEHLDGGRGAIMRQAFKSFRKGEDIADSAVDLTGGEIFTFANVLREAARKASNNNRYDISRALEDVAQGLIEQGAMRSGSRGAVGAARQAYREYAILRDAMAKSDIDVAPTPAQMKRARRANIQKYNRGDPPPIQEERLQDITDVSRTMTSTRPDSGTSEREALQRALAILGGGAAFLNPALLTPFAVAGGLGGMYATRPTTAALRQGLLAPGRITQALGGRFGGMIGGANAQE